jgi:hypothetical protein
MVLWEPNIIEKVGAVVTCSEHTPWMTNGQTVIPLCIANEEESRPKRLR